MLSDKVRHSQTKVFCIAYMYEGAFYFGMGEIIILALASFRHIFHRVHTHQWFVTKCILALLYLQCISSSTQDQLHLTNPPASPPTIAMSAPHQAHLPSYQYGFGNEFSSEALPGALPRHNNPHRCPYSLYAEQVSGTAFTVPRSRNLRTWMYRIRPSASQDSIVPAPDLVRLVTVPDHVTPERLRWRPEPITSSENDGRTFVEGLVTIAGAGDPADRNGLSIYTYTANTSMVNSCFSSSDGDMLIVPEKGLLRFQTELGDLVVPPGHIIVIPRGIRFAVKFVDQNSPSGVTNNGAARGYVLEVYSGSFQLPDLGLIGANGLANARDFRYPIAKFTEENGRYVAFTKFQGDMFTSNLYSSPFDVVAWHGNYSPFAYDLSLFCPVNSVLFDHSDPSIFTVLTVPSTTPGVAIADFVIFPPRWATQEDTFRLPYFHRNCMSEYMGVIFGSYEAKDGGKFGPGASTLHSIMAPHGPDAVSYREAMKNDHADQPRRLSSKNLAFMFETCKMLKLTGYAMTSECRDRDYAASWNGLETPFDKNRPGPN